MADPRYDIIVIGSGPAGYVAAIHAAQLGLKTALVEKDGAFGGTCLHRGCIPTKALLETAHLLDRMREAKEFGIRADNVALDLVGAHTYKARVVAANAKGVAFLLEKNKVETFRGWGSLAGHMRVRVAGEGGGEHLLQAVRGVVLATGSACKHLPFIEMDHQRTIDSDDILELREVPKRLVVVGAGAVGTEFASIFARFGSEVTLVEVLDQVLPLEDTEISRALERALKRQGIRLLTGARVDKVRRSRAGVRTDLVVGDGKAVTIESDKLLVATGRRPLTSGIGLETTTITPDERGFIPVDGFMRTEEPGIYAIGDIVPTAMLAHLGSHEGMLAVDHAAGRPAHPINPLRVPSCTYCDPEVASVGLTEQAARDLGYDVKVATFPFTASSKAKIQREPEGLVKLVGERRHDELLGIHIVGPKATELIAEGVLALNLEVTAEEIMHTIHPHPTLSEAVGEAGHGLFAGQPIHL